MKNSGSKGAVFTGVIAALVASSCCIPPLMALVAGVGGGAASLSWIEPLRPYLVGFAIVAIGYAWYAHFKAKKVDDCGCEEKPKFFQKRGFLIGMTIFAILAITLPYYSGVFYPDNAKEVMVVDSRDIKEVEISIDGMTCASCEKHVDHAINELEGIISVHSSYETESTTVEYDQTKTSYDQIISAINSTGYTAIENGK